MKKEKINRINADGTITVIKREVSERTEEEAARERKAQTLAAIREKYTEDEEISILRKCIYALIENKFDDAIKAEFEGYNEYVRRCQEKANSRLV